MSPHPRAAATQSSRVRLFCLPYAGGAAQLFHGWSRYDPGAFEFRPVELPGRGSRYCEAPCQGIEELVTLVAAELAPELSSGVPFALFGHSMGALIAYELARCLRDRGEIQPSHLFVSGSCAPHRRPERRRWYDAPLPAFLEELRLLNGSSPAALDNAELVAAVLPYLRADFRMVQCYDWRPGVPLDVPVTAFIGQDDRDVGGAAWAWKAMTTAPFSCHVLAGDHFFLREQTPALVRCMAEVMRSSEVLRP